MVRREAFINKIRELNYTYKRRQKRTELWRRRGGTEFIALPMRDLLAEEYVTSTLRQAGLSDDEIKTFIAGHPGIDLQVRPARRALSAEPGMGRLGEPRHGRLGGKLPGLGAGGRRSLACDRRPEAAGGRCKARLSDLICWSLGQAAAALRPLRTTR